jgi:hypothetical protein
MNRHSLPARLVILAAASATLAFALTGKPAR